MVKKTKAIKGLFGRDPAERLWVLAGELVADDVRQQHIIATGFDLPATQIRRQWGAPVDKLTREQREMLRVVCGGRIDTASNVTLPWKSVSVLSKRTTAKAIVSFIVTRIEELAAERAAMPPPQLPAV